MSLPVDAVDTNSKESVLGTPVPLGPCKLHDVVELDNVHTSLTPMYDMGNGSRKYPHLKLL